MEPWENAEKGVAFTRHRQVLVEPPEDGIFQMAFFSIENGDFCRGFTQRHHTWRFGEESSIC